jgi:hypothetical protein
LANQPLKPGGANNLAVVRNWFSYATDNVFAVVPPSAVARQFRVSGMCYEP